MQSCTIISRGWVQRQQRGGGGSNESSYYLTTAMSAKAWSVRLHTTLAIMAHCECLEPTALHGRNGKLHHTDF
jgi:hypothetical protein